MFYPLERLINLHDGYRRPYVVAGHSLLLLQEEGRRYLLRNQCPHQQAPLSSATVNNGRLRCPVHGMEFDLVTGKTTDGCNQSLQFITIVYEGNQIGLDL